MVSELCVGGFYVDSGGFFVGVGRFSVGANVWVVVDFVIKKKIVWKLRKCEKFIGK